MKHFSSPTGDLYAHEIQKTIEGDGFTAIVADYGAGKTHLMRRVKQLLEGQNVTVIQSVDLSDRTVTIGSILRDVILALGEEPKRSSSALSHQAVRLLGQAVKVQRRKVCLVVDDAHRLHGETLSALKRLRERDFAGIAPLLSVVLLGHPSLADTLARRNEIGWRCDVLPLDEDHGWMTPAERVRYLETVFGAQIEPQTRSRIAAMHRLPEEMNQFVRQTLRDARRAGIDVLDERTVRPTLAEQKEALGVSLKAIATEAHVPKTTVHEAIQDGDTHPASPQVRAAMDKIAAATQARQTPTAAKAA